MTAQVYSKRAEAMAALRAECLPAQQHVFDDANGQSLVELVFAEIASEPLFIKSNDGSASHDGRPGYGAYIPRFGLIINQQKAALMAAVLIVDVLLTSGLAAFVLNQVIKDPIFVKRLVGSQHLMCVLHHDAWAQLTIEEFQRTLTASQCKHPHLSCAYRSETGTCGLSAPDLQSGIHDLNEFFRLK